MPRRRVHSTRPDSKSCHALRFVSGRTVRWLGSGIQFTNTAAANGPLPAGASFGVWRSGLTTCSGRSIRSYPWRCDGISREGSLLLPTGQKITFWQPPYEITSSILTGELMAVLTTFSKVLHPLWISQKKSGQFVPKRQKNGVINENCS